LGVGGGRGNASDNFRENDFLIRHLVNSTNQRAPAIGWASNWPVETTIRPLDSQLPISSRDFLFLLCCHLQRFDIDISWPPSSPLISSLHAQHNSQPWRRAINRLTLCRENPPAYLVAEGNTGNGEQSAKLTYVSRPIKHYIGRNSHFCSLLNELISLGRSVSVWRQLKLNGPKTQTCRWVCG